MDYLPVFLDLRGQDTLVVGGGEVAARKVALLRQTGASVRVVSPQLCDKLEASCHRGEISYSAARFDPADLQGALLVIAATDDPEINATVAAAARSCRLPVNVVDQPALCSFIMPAILNQGSVVIAISSGGAAPVLTRFLRARLLNVLPKNLATVADLLRRQRARVKAALPDPRQRRWFWEEILERSADLEEPDFEALLAEAPQVGGRLDIINVPVDATDLLTLRAVRKIQRADLVLHDPVIPQDVLDYARRDAVLRAVPDLAHRTDEEAEAAVANGDAVVALWPGSEITGCATP